MNRNQREARRKHFEGLKQTKAAQAKAKQQKEAELAAKVETRLKKGTRSPQQLVEEALQQGTGHSLYSRMMQSLAPFRAVQGEGFVTAMLGSDDQRAVLLRTVAKLTPKLIEAEMMLPLVAVGRLEWVRPVTTWKPNGKSRETIFRSLAEHLLAKYPTPPFLWSAFFTSSTHADLPAIVARVAGGEALYDCVKDKSLPVQLTRKQCHEFLQTTIDYSFLGALRRIQVLAHGGDQRLFQVWYGSRIAAELQEPSAEEFWETVLRFFARNPMLDRAKIQPLIDFIRTERFRRPAFSMKGRTAQNLLDDMHKWHGELARQKTLTGATFEPAGYKPGEYEREYTDRTGTERVIWTVTEVLTGKELADEGRILHHCVYSYAGSINSRRTSIWSLRANGQRVMTIEVANSSHTVVQYRGKHNALPKAREFQILQLWAGANQLTVASRSW